MDKKILTEILLVIISSIILTLINKEIGIILVTAIFFIYFFYKKEKIHIPYIISLIITFIWLLIAHNLYKYNGSPIYILGTPLFTLLAWPLGLTILYDAYKRTVKRYIKQRTPWKKLGIWTLWFVPGLIIIETVGYHVFNIQLTSNYPGLPICDCMHIPLWAKVAYFSMGFIFYLIITIVEKQLTKK